MHKRFRMRLVPLRAAVASVFHSENFINKRNAEWERNKMHLVHDGSLVRVFKIVSLRGRGGVRSLDACGEK